MSVAGGAVAALVSYSGRLFHQHAKVSVGQRSTHRNALLKYVDEKTLLRCTWTSAAVRMDRPDRRGRVMVCLASHAVAGRAAHTNWYYYCLEQHYTIYSRRTHLTSPLHLSPLWSMNAIFIKKILQHGETTLLGNTLLENTLLVRCAPV